jgi:RecB family exonuclease
VIYYGFTELDQNQIDLLAAVRRVVPVTVFFPYADAPGYAFVKDFLETVLVPMADRKGAAPGRAPPPRVVQRSVSGAHDEVWAAAKEILRFAERGIPFRRIALVARTLEPYLDLVDAVFREHRIPWVSSAERPLAHDPRVKAARLLFTVDDFDRGRVLDLLRSPFFRGQGGDRELWDQASRLMGIGHGAGEWRRRLGGAAGADWVQSVRTRAGREPFRLPRAELDLFWDAVRGLLDAPPPPETGWKAYADWALGRLRRFLEPDERIEEALGALARLEGFALEEPREALLDALARLSEPAGDPELAGVRVYDAMAARGCTFDAVVAIGLNERVFPRFILEDPFLRDAVRLRFQFRLGNRIPLKLRGHDEERLLFTLLESSAPDLVFVHQRSDEKGRLRIASPFLPLPESRPIPRRPSLRLEETDFPLLTPLEASLRTGQGEALGRALGRDVSLFSRARGFLEAIERRGPLTPYDGLVDTRTYWPKLASAGISPTSLERLAECPFKYFAHGMLGLEELDEPEGETALSPLETGDLYHAVLEEFHKKGDLDRRLADAFRGFEGGRSIRYPVLWEVEKERIAKVLRAFVDADDCSVYRPKDFEVELQGELAIEAGGRSSVRFRGYADRLDLAADGAFRVVDYKRSGRKYKDTMETGVFQKGRYLQPPLYFLLALMRLGAPAARSRFVYYFLEEVLEGKSWEKELTGEMWGRKAEFDALLRRLLDRIARGEFFVRDGRHCSFCEFRPMCRRSHWPTRVRAEEADA